MFNFREISASLFATAALCFPILVQADVYRCSKTNGAVYSQFSCGSNSVRIQSKPEIGYVVAQLDAASGARLYKIDGRINGNPLVFIVDTGATITSIPKEMKAKLHLGSCITAEITTANGPATGCIAKAKTLNIGHLQLNDVDVVVMPNLDFPLLGMNAIEQLDVAEITRAGFKLSKSR